MANVVIESRDSSRERTIIRALGDVSFEPTQETVKLFGGSQPFAWASENGNADASVSLTVKQYDAKALKYLNAFDAAALTENSSGDTTGATVNLANVEGTSVFDATTGVASVAPKSGENPIYGDYLLVAASATTVDIYLNNNLGSGVDLDDALKITGTPITIPGTGGTIDIPTANITLTGGSGAIAMTTGNIARFNARPINNYNFEFQFGKAAACFNEFSMWIIVEKDFSTFETELSVLYDSSLDYAAKFEVIGR